MNFESATQSARSESELTTREAALTDIEGAISAAKNLSWRFRRDDGHFVFELEADATIPAEYVLMRHYLAEPVDAALEGLDRELSAPHPIGRWWLAARA